MLKSIRKFMYNLPLRGKLVVFFLLASVIPLLCVSIYSYQVFRKQLVVQLHDRMDTMNSQISSNIQNKITNYEQISSLLYMDSTLREMLTRDYHRAIDFVDAYKYINSLIFGIQLSNSDIDSITIYPYNQSIPSDGLFIKHVDASMEAEPWYQELQQSYGNAVYSIVTKRDSDEPVVTLARLLNNHNLMQAYGVLTIDVKESALHSLFQQEAQSNDIYIVNQDSTILSARNKEMILKQLNEVLGSGPWEDNGKGTIEQRINGLKTMVVYHEMPIGWKTVSVVPLHNVLSEVRKATNRILIISAMSILLAIGLIAMTAKYFSNRFQTLYRFIRKVGDEDFNFELKQEGNDEIGQLAEEFNKMKHQLDKLINEVYKKEIMRKEAELYALQSQINPHFLYNTLSVIASLAIRNQDSQVGKVVNHLSNFYKTSLSKGKHVILIQNEVGITRHYIEIQLMRFNNLFRVHWQLNEELFKHQTVKLILQPFVENAINHAIWHESNPINIIIRLYQKEQCIYFEVVDDGAGMTARRMADILQGNKDYGYGIYNVHERIQLAYGSAYGISINSRLGIGTQIIIAIPIV
ncbi:sensor histidine kinase [Paenibacillaceae bacterium]|nr:sensor histidine kinase [Paenibacillaceae bacterium]